MKVAIITGSGGLVGSEAARFYLDKGYLVAGIDNDMRAEFFGQEASTKWQSGRLAALSDNYHHFNIDIRDQGAISRVFEQYNSDIKLVIHTAAQPSHDWAAKDPIMDFTVNANGTSVMLETTRLHAPKATFIFTSTNKVYGDTPNRLPLIEKDTRWEIDPEHPYAKHGIDETMSIDNTKHSLFGASKVAADVLVQEYGKYFGMNTGIFRGGCLTGPGHSGAELHGFLSYLMKCAITSKQYNIFGYNGKQVRDNIHSADLIAAFDAFHQAPRQGEVYNMGGSQFSNCSMQEAITICEEITNKKMNTLYVDDNRVGDHIWWVSSVEKFKSHYAHWTLTYNVPAILQEIYTAFIEKKAS